jgi:hypothetical protein
VHDGVEYSHHNENTSDNGK